MRSPDTIRKSSRGGSVIEFALLTPLMVSLMLGTLGIGVNLLRTQRTIQLARDAGHMYARGAKVWAAGYQQLIASLGSNVGLTVNPGTSSAVVILSKVSYMDTAACLAAGSPGLDPSGNPISCNNWKKWVFDQRIVIGSSTVRASNFGSLAGIALNSKGEVSPASQRRTNTAARAQFITINPYDAVTNAGLPAKEYIYISEAASRGFGLPPITSSTVTAYSFSMF
jgi:hypothetical protein